LWNFLLRHRFKKVVVNHANRSETAARKALNKFDAVLSVRTFQEVIAVSTLFADDVCVFAKRIEQLVAACHGTGKGSADPDVMLA
jgi:urease accessory protein UreE